MIRNHGGHHHRTRAQRRRLRKQIKKAYDRKVSHHACPRYKSKGEIDGAGGTGANQLPFSGWVGDLALKPGNYRATIVATDGGRNQSSPKRARFSVLGG